MDDLIINEKGDLIRCNITERVVDLTPTKIKRITKKAFEKCTNMRELILPVTLQVICDEAFSKCINLREITFLNNTTDIQGNPFINTQWYKKKMNHDGYIYVCDTLIAFKEHSPYLTSAFKNIRRINYPAFSKKKDIKTLDFSDSIKLAYIEPWAFSSCDNLVQIIFNEDCKIEEIKRGTFSSCYKLEEVKLPKNLKNIEKKAFFDTKWFSLQKDDFTGFYIYKNMLLQDGQFPLKYLDLESIYPDLETICPNAFWLSTYETIHLPSKLKRIMDYAFDSSASLKQINLPESLEYIGERIFNRCINLETDELFVSPKTIVNDHAFWKE